MKIAIRFFLWTFATVVDNILHAIFDRFEFECFLGEWQYEFCQWAWLGWDRCCDDIDRFKEVDSIMKEGE